MSGLTFGQVISTDEQIVALERLIDAGHVTEYIQVLEEKDRRSTMTKIHVATFGTSMGKAREMLKEALKGIDDMIGKEKV